MSLNDVDWRPINENAWKAILDQPKNAGLKAGGGTGVSGALRKAVTARGTFDGQKTEAHGQALDRALSELKTTCESTVKKHKALFTTACEHLKKVIKAADDSMKALTADLNVIRQEERERAQRAESRKNLKAVCDLALANVRKAKDMNELHTFWDAFAKGLEKDGHGRPEVQQKIQKVKAFNKQPDPTKRVGILDVRKDYIDLVQEVEGAVG
jgi:hypothetical protein